LKENVMICAVMRSSFTSKLNGWG